jgi:hypothetical protein
VEEKSIVIAKLLLKIDTRKRLLFQAARIPPEAPIEGWYSKESKGGEQIFLRKGRSKFSFLVSWRQTISH